MGDTIQIRVQDAMGNATSTVYEFEVGALFENYIYNYLYMTEDAYEQAATTLARAFYENFTKKYPDMPEEIKKAGPQP